MGGDHAPTEVIKGALLAIQDYPIRITLVGQESVIAELSQLGVELSDRLDIAMLLRQLV